MLPNKPSRPLLLGLFSSALATAVAQKPLAARQDEPAPPVAQWPHQTFMSRPDLQPPVLNITKYAPVAPGYLFITVAGDAAHNYSTFIMTDEGELVYQSTLGIFTNAHVQTIYPPTSSDSASGEQQPQGQQVFTYFNGITYGEPWGMGYGIVQLLDHTYTSVGNVTVESGIEVLHFQETDDSWLSYIDMHESRIINPPYSDPATQGGSSMLVTAYNTTPADLTAVSGPQDGWILDGVFYEKDVATGEVLFEWSHLEHVDEVPFEGVLDYYPLEDLGQNGSYPWGPFHINSVDKFADGSYLVSSRYYCSLFRIAKTGEVLWRLDGQKGHDFTLLNSLQFAYQHDAIIRSPASSTSVGTGIYNITIFDNAWSSVKSSPANGRTNSRGLVIQIDEAAKTATLVQSYEDPADPLKAVSQANLQIVSMGGGDGEGGEAEVSDGKGKHVVLGCGYVPKIKEFDYLTGETVMSVQFGDLGNVQSYRGYKMPWVGRPVTKPDVVALKEDGVVKVYASWNGATEVKGWNVFAGPSENGEGMRKVADGVKTGFETVVEVAGCGEADKYVRVQATGEGIAGGESAVVAII